MKNVSLFFIVLFSMLAFGQRTCGTPQKMQELYSKNPELKAYSVELRNYLRNPNNLKKVSRVNNVITVPVVVHVLYKNATQNITDAQIQSQIQVLNNDFRKLNADFSSVVPVEFQPYAADLELAFCMATKDPNGNSTTGIVRKSVSTSFNFDNNYYTAAGDLAWDPTKYLNIWVGAFTDNTLLGWAYLPDAAGLAYDGLCIGYKYFGTVGTATAPYNKGRTATHEIGHYFGLNHPWGEADYGNVPDSTVCGTLGWDDFCADTPATYYPYFGTPVFPDFENVCDPGTYTNGAMFMNFMDYVDDSSMAFFTLNQKTITSNTMSGPRASLLNSNGCANLSTTETEKLERVSLYPNPASYYISVSSPLINVDEIEVFDNSGKLVLTKNRLKTNELIDVKKLTAGIYYVRIYSKGNLLKSEKFIKK